MGEKRERQCSGMFANTGAAIGDTDTFGGGSKDGEASGEAISFT